MKCSSDLNKTIIFISLFLLLSGCATLGGKTDLIKLRETANTYYQNGSYEKSLAIFTKLVKEVPEDAELWFKKGNCHVRLRQPDLAIEAYQASVSRDPRYYKAWYNLSRTYLKQTGNAATQMLSLMSPDHPLYEEAVNMTKGVLDTLRGDSIPDISIDPPPTSWDKNQ